MAKLVSKEDYTKRYARIVAWSDEDDAFVARVAEFKGCSAHGDTPESAVKNLEEAIIAYLETMEEKKVPFPEPAATAKQKKAFPLRLDSKVFLSIQTEAAILGKSMNEIIQERLKEEKQVEITVDELQLLLPELKKKIAAKKNIMAGIRKRRATNVSATKRK